MKITELLEAYDNAKKDLKSSCVLVVWTDQLFADFQKAMWWPNEKVNSAYIFWTPVFFWHDFSQIPFDVFQKYDLLTIVKKDEVVVFDKKSWLEEWKSDLFKDFERTWPMYPHEPGWRIRNPLSI